MLRQVLFLLLVSLCFANGLINDQGAHDQDGDVQVSSRTQANLVNTLRREIAELQGDLVDEQDKNDRLRSRLQRLHHKCSMSEKEEENAGTKGKHGGKRVHALKLELEQKEKEIDFYKAEYRQLEEKYQALQTSLNELAKHLGDAVSESKTKIAQTFIPQSLE